MKLWPLSLLSVLLAAVWCFPLSAQTSPDTVTHTCHAVHGAPNAGEDALARKDYEQALGFYRDALTHSPADGEARLGLVRALIGLDKVDEATAEAAAFIQKSHSSVAEIAAAEAAYRAADFEAMRDHARNAFKLDECEGRALDVIAGFYELHAYFATEAKLLNMAHRLRPDDELILRDWISSLPRKQRQEELTKYLAGRTSLSERDRHMWEIAEEHLKARRPGECHASSKTETVKVPFTPMYRDAAHLEAYGLDVAFNGKKRRMQIDTGASGILLTPGAARRLGLTAEFHLKTGGIGDQGSVDSYLTHVDVIEIGNVTFANCMVEVLQKDRLDGVDGLIGLDVFDRWLATLDYPGTQLLLNPLPPRPGEKTAGLNDSAPPGELQDNDGAPHDPVIPDSMKDWLHVIRIGHDVLLPAALNGGRTHYVIMDTGSSQTVLASAFAHEAGKLHEESMVQFTGISGKINKTYVLDRAELIFGGMFRLPQMGYFAFDMSKLSHDEDVEVSGLIGLPTLSLLTITVDYRDNLLQFKYDPKRAVVRFQ